MSARQTAIAAAGESECIQSFLKTFKRFSYSMTFFVFLKRIWKNSFPGEHIMVISGLFCHLCYRGYMRVDELMIIFVKLCFLTWQFVFNVLSWECGRFPGGSCRDARLPAPPVQSSAAPLLCCREGSAGLSAVLLQLIKNLG